MDPQTVSDLSRLGPSQFDPLVADWSPANLSHLLLSRNILGLRSPACSEANIPPMITGTPSSPVDNKKEPVVSYMDRYGRLLIGAALVGDSGALNWGGGAAAKTTPQVEYSRSAPRYSHRDRCPGDPPGSSAFLSFVSIILTELFGSPFLKNISIIVGLAVGVLGKISGALLAIPNFGLGGVITFLFASVAVSGLRVLSFTRYSRRDRFVLPSAISFGLADLLVPQLFTHLFDGVKNPNSALEGFFKSITIILSTPFLAAGIVGLMLNIILPREQESMVSEDTETGAEKQLESGQGSGV
ncbi:hypothetical protein C8R46DRAFT_1234700 [Mycena filopes]|nr:hypothetical protein C8R46DRAFT_1234700 [Mycena filopes]